MEKNSTCPRREYSVVRMDSAVTLMKLHKRTLMGAIFIAFVVVLLGSNFWRYQTFGFCGDGFIYHVALRNMALHGEPWSGPFYEYLPAKHTYLTFLALAPLVYVWDSPSLWVVLSVGCYAAGVWLAWKIAAYMFGKNNQTIALLLTACFAIHPLALGGVTSCGCLFQPDIMEIPLGMAVLLYALRRHRLGFLLSAMALLLVKEELIVFGNAWVLLCGYFGWVVRPEARFRDSGFPRILFVTVACLGLVSIGILVLQGEFRALSPYVMASHKVQFVNMWKSLESSWDRVIGDSLILAGYWLAVFLPARFLGHVRWQWQPQIPLLGAFIIFRAACSGIVSQYPVDGIRYFRYYWGNSLALNAVFLLCLASFRPVHSNGNLPFRRVLGGVVAVMLGLLAVLGSCDILRSISRFLIQWPWYPPSWETRLELKAVKEMVPKRGDGRSVYIIVPDRSEAYFEDWTSLKCYDVLDWWDSQSVIGRTRARILSGASRIIVAKFEPEHLTWSDLGMQRGLIRRVGETKNFMIYEGKDRP